MAKFYNGCPYCQRWQWQRLTLQLLVRLFEVIAVQVAVAARPNEITNRKIRLLRDHVRKHRVRSDIKRYAQEEVTTAVAKKA